MTAMPSCTSISVVGAIVAAVMAAADLANTLARSWTLKADLQGFLRRFPVHGLPCTGARIALADLVVLLPVKASTTMSHQTQQLQFTHAHCSLRQKLGDRHP